jgi:hypothetical protein
MARIYATTEDLTTYLGAGGTVPANATSLLRSASLLISSETRTAVYPTDSGGYALDTTVRAAFRDAACAQVMFWDAMKIDPTLGAAGVAPIAASKSIRGASIQYSTYVSTAQARANAAGVLGPDAWYALDEVGLLNQPPTGY